MPSIYQLKPAFQNALRPGVGWLARIGVTANQVTLAACGLSFAAGGLLGLFPAVPGLFWVVPPLLFVRMALNAIDGMLAREHGMQTALGAVLNELTDVLADAALYLPFALVPGVGAGWIVIVVLLGVIAEMTGVIGAQIGASRRYDGPFGKSDRAFFFGALSVLIALEAPLAGWLGYLLGAAALLGALTIVNRARHALREG